MVWAPNVFPMVKHMWATTKETDQTVKVNIIGATVTTIKATLVTVYVMVKVFSNKAKQT